MKHYYSNINLETLVVAGIFMLCTLTSNSILAQNVGINEDGSAPNPNAILDIKSETKGLLIPRMSTSDRTSITVGASELGIMVYDTTVKAFFFYDGTEWKELSEVLWAKDAVGINRSSNIGVNALAQPRYGIYSYREYGDVGPDSASIYGYRGGHSGSDTTGGISFSRTGIDAAVKGFSDWGNPYSAAVAGYGYLDFANSASVLGANNAGSIYGALGFNDGSSTYAGYFMGNARFNNKVGIGADPNSGSFSLNVQSSTDDRTAYFYNTKNSSASTYGVYGGAFGTGSGDKRGGSFDAFSGTGTNIGVRATASNGSTNIGMYSAASGGTTNWAGHFDNGYVIVDDRIGVGSTSPNYKIHVYNNDLTIGGYFYSLYSSASTTYGLYATATNPGAGSTRAVYASASGTGNYAIYGVGDSYFSGDVRLGTTLNPPGYKLIVNGKIISEELRIQNSTDWPDYVFEADYNLLPLNDLKHAIAQKGHLPGIPSASEVESDGIAVGDMQKRMMEKIEELTLYVIDLNERIQTLEAENEALQHQQNKN